MDISGKDLLTYAATIVAVVGSHFTLRARVAVLEERVKGYSKAIERVFEALRRIEDKLDSKADRD